MSSENTETPERILNAAWQLLENKPNSGVRMSDIAKQAGLSRQAVYLHFKTRSELLIATTRYIDDVKGVEQRFNILCDVTSGTEHLVLFIKAWGNYIPEVYGVAKALLAMKDSDEAASSAWDDRMKAVRDGCNAAIVALDKDKVLSSVYTIQQATDILWTILSIRNWEQFTVSCGWSQKQYIRNMTQLAKQILCI